MFPHPTDCTDLHYIINPGSQWERRTTNNINKHLFYISLSLYSAKHRYNLKECHTKFSSGSDEKNNVLSIFRLADAKYVYFNFSDQTLFEHIFIAHLKIFLSNNMAILMHVIVFTSNNSTTHLRIANTCYGFYFMK